MIQLAALLFLVEPGDAILLRSAPTNESAAPSEKSKTAVRIPDGIDVKLVLDETLSSRSNVKGDLFRLKVAEPVLVDGAEALAAGTVVIGEITNAQTKSAFGVSGKLEARTLYAQTPNGTVRLSGRLGQKGKGGTTETVLTYAMIGAISFVVTGKSATIPAGTELVARTGEH
jgi:hypothetical protein